MRRTIVPVVVTLFGATMGIGCGDDAPSGASTVAAESGATGGGGSGSGTGGVANTGGVAAAGAPQAGAGSGGDAAGAGGTGAGGATTRALYAVATQIFGETETNTYLLLSDGVGTPTLDHTSGQELPGRALVSGRPGGGAVFVGGSDGPALTRYELVNERLVAGKSVAFAGVTSFGEYQSQFIHISDEKAYYLDGKTAQVVSWNPKTMTQLGSTGPIAALSLAGHGLSFTSTSVIRTSNRVVVPVSWRSSDNTKIPAQTGVLVLDTTTDQATVVTDTRAGYVRDAVDGGDGYAYLATEAFGSALYRLAPSSAPAPCLLRFDLAKGVFDPSYKVDLQTLTGATAGSLVPDTQAGTALVRVLDESLTTINAETIPRALASAPAWRWSTLTLGAAPKATASAELPPSGGSVLLYPGVAQSFHSEFGATATTVRQLTGASAGKALLTVPGRVFSLIQVQ